MHHNDILMASQKHLNDIVTTSEGVKVSPLELTLDCFYYWLSNSTVKLKKGVIEGNKIITSIN